MKSNIIRLKRKEVKLSLNPRQAQSLQSIVNDKICDIDTNLEAYRAGQICSTIPNYEEYLLEFRAELNETLEQVTSGLMNLH